jgi:hypothetical protein
MVARLTQACPDCRARSVRWLLRAPHGSPSDQPSTRLTPACYWVEGGLGRRPGLVGRIFAHSSIAWRDQIRPIASSTSGAGKSGWAMSWCTRCCDTPRIVAISGTLTKSRATGARVCEA